MILINFVYTNQHYFQQQQNNITLFPRQIFTEMRRHQLVKQDSVLSFVDHRRGFFAKQDSVIQYPTSTRSGDGHHVSILKKSESPRKAIEFVG